LDVKNIYIYNTCKGSNGDVSQKDGRKDGDCAVERDSLIRVPSKKEPEGTQELMQL